MRYEKDTVEKTEETDIFIKYINGRAKIHRLKRQTYSFTEKKDCNLCCYYET